MSFLSQFEGSRTVFPGQGLEKVEANPSRSRSPGFPLLSPRQVKRHVVYLNFHWGRKCEDKLLFTHFHFIFMVGPGTDYHPLPAQANKELELRTNPIFLP